MFKKPIYKIIYFIIIMALLFYIENKYYFFYNIACGTGIEGLKMILIVSAGILAIILLKWSKNKSRKIYCEECLSPMEDDWSMCPYCGWEREGDD